MKRLLLSLVILCCASSSGYASSKAGYVWNKLQDGLSYAHLTYAHSSTSRNTTIHAFRVDPKKLRLDIITSSANKTMGESVKAMARRERALVAVNGGFFTPAHKSIGLLVKAGRRINPIHHTSWWSVFGIRNNKASILPPWKARSVRGYRMALQAGPRLVVGGRVPRLKENTPHARTAVGITKNGDVIIVATSGAGITMNEFADVMRKNRFKGGLNCVDAMALDGGSSTQLYAKAGKVDLSFSGFSTVPNSLAVFSK